MKHQNILLSLLIPVVSAQNLAGNWPPVDVIVQENSQW